MRTLVAAIVVLGACTNDPQITDGVCGNFVRDPGEDCDLPGAAADSHCTAECRIACVRQPPCPLGTSLATCPLPQHPSLTLACSSADALDGTCCPGGMACGVDGTCHAPSGALQPSFAVPFAATNLFVADVNGDLIDDVLGTGGGLSAIINHGASTSPLADQLVVPTPEAAAPPAFGDFDGDGVVDMVIPTARGLFALADGTGTPTPLAFPIDTSPTVGVVANTNHERIGRVAGAGYPRLVELDHTSATDGTSPTLQLQVIDPPAPGAQNFAYAAEPPATTLCGAKPAFETVRGRGLHPFLDGTTIRVPLVLNGTKICIATANPSSGDPGYSITMPTVPSGTYVFNGGTAGEMSFANLLGGSCPDLIVPVYASGVASTMVIAGAAAIPGPGCAVDTTKVLTMLGAPFAAISLATTPPTPGIVTSQGIYAVSALLPKLVSLPTRAWQYAVVADLDRDGIDDFVTMAAGNDIEVFRQHPAPTTVPQWSDFVIQTIGPVRKLDVGNFDGDASLDIAFATFDSVTPPPVGPATVSIAWGSVDGAFTTVDVGTFANASDFTAIDLYDPSLPVTDDSCTDLVIAHGGPVWVAPTTQVPVPPPAPGSTDTGSLIAEYGSTARTLSAPFDYVTCFTGCGQATPVLEPAQGQQALVGRYGAGGRHGMLGLFTPSAANESPDVALLDLTYDAATSSLRAAPMPTIMPGCGADATSLPDMFCPNNASFTSMPRDQADLVIGYVPESSGQAQQASCWMAYYVVGTSEPPMPTSVPCSAVAPEASSSSDPDVVAAFAALNAIDRFSQLDDDGITEHVGIGTAGGSASVAGKGAAFLWDLTDDGGMPHFANPIAINTEVAMSGVLAEQAACYAVFPIELGSATGADGAIYGDATHELLVQCSVGTPQHTILLGRYVASDGGAPLYRVLAPEFSAVLSSVRTGDVNGDGLDDIIIPGNGTASAGTLTVLLQCDAHAAAAGCGASP